jgi:hypothetical protein
MTKEQFFATSFLLQLACKDDYINPYLAPSAKRICKLVIGCDWSTFKVAATSCDSPDAPDSADVVPAITLAELLVDEKKHTINIV